MLVQMVRIWHMSMGMPQRLMSMHVAVRPRWHGFVGVQMVPIVMRMGMFVLKYFVLMFMAVRFK